MKDAVIVRRVLKLLDAEPQCAASFNDRGLGGSGRFEGAAAAAHIGHVFFFEFAVDGGFFAVVAVGVGVVAFAGDDVPVKVSVVDDMR